MIISEKNKPLPSQGFLIVYKPVGPTSHDIIDSLRKITQIKKIGHAGTLDPFARGVLIIAISREYTKRLSEFSKLDKVYVADLFLGAVTDTFDVKGNIRSNKITKIPSLEFIKNKVNKFIGPQKQIPPMFSAKKVNGKKLYNLARQGKTIKREATDINIYKLKILNYEWPNLRLEIYCSAGTYIRSLGHDIGQSLGCGAYLKDLERTAIGTVDKKDAVSLEKLNKENWQEYILQNINISQ